MLCHAYFYHLSYLLYNQCIRKSEYGFRLRNGIETEERIFAILLYIAQGLLLVFPPHRARESGAFFGVPATKKHFKSPSTLSFRQ